MEWKPHRQVHVSEHCEAQLSRLDRSFSQFFSQPLEWKKRWRIAGSDVGYSYRAHQEIFSIYQQAEVRASWPVDPSMPQLHEEIKAAFETLEQLARDSLLESVTQCGSRERARVQRAVLEASPLSVLRVILYNDDLVSTGETGTVLDHAHVDSCLAALCLSCQSGLQVAEGLPEQWKHVESGSYRVATLLAGERLHRIAGINATRHRVIHVRSASSLTYRRLAFAFLLQGFAKEEDECSLRHSMKVTGIIAIAFALVSYKVFHCR